MIKLKRAYEEPAEADGYRVLVDRLWPRGVSKEQAQVNEWLKEVAPSNELRKWFHHEAEKFAEFKEKYEAELAQGTGKEAFAELLEIVSENPVVTLVYGAKDTVANQAVCLKEWLEAESS
ncbi:MarR family transcriptional regulator [Enterococcus sp. JM4C]|uniref:DUF488 domain-containing protein n=1 Tax=Candidatus Enterococcus huntleyi TaxID=1857217 RepID=UPI00137AD1FC|nr:DUF488 domain-containing protein [Enterococcus sp. JM4C]KAF1296788.1 MarR family transcriptional regulator [Enterococcus sp. JM4C]